MRYKFAIVQNAWVDTCMHDPHSCVVVVVCVQRFGYFAIGHNVCDANHIETMATEKSDFDGNAEVPG